MSSPPLDTRQETTHEAPLVRAFQEYVGKDIYVELRNRQRVYGYAHQLERLGDAIYMRMMTSMEFEPVSRDPITAEQFRVKDVFYARIDTASVLTMATPLHKERFGPDLNTLVPSQSVGDFLETLNALKGCDIVAGLTASWLVAGKLVGIEQDRGAAWIRILGPEGFAGFVDGEMRTSEMRLLNLANVDRLYMQRD